ncbi:3-oxoacyl-[acyl-carrier-protein] reductase [candidate division KSB1 bacterium RBG_16_48_16]|nr:MAG: 3-oxoacyl-[acyl-carrier-protein] reductase [candidate division KSB1 bacterium RBG_16_48_16]
MAVLDNKVSVVTGAARGIGKAIALRLAEHGSDIVVSDIDLAGVQGVAKEIEAMGRKAIAVESNVSIKQHADALVEAAVGEFGKIDVFVNNAGITRDNLIMRMDEAEWDAVISVNLKGTFNCIKAVTRPMMKQRNGKIINISSIVGVMGNAGQANYSASKAGVIGLTKSAAKELAARNVQVNAVAPGYIETEMTKNLPETIRENYLTVIPLKRPGAPEDVANVVLFLASPLSDYMTGQVLHVDGGMLM